MFFKNFKIKILNSKFNYFSFLHTMSSTFHRIILCLTISPVLITMRKILSESAIERAHVISVNNGFNSKRMTKLNFSYRNMTLPCLSKKKNPVSSVNALLSKALKNKPIIEQTWVYWLIAEGDHTICETVRHLSKRCCNRLIVGLELVLGFWGGFKEMGWLWFRCYEEVRNNSMIGILTLLI